MGKQMGKQWGNILPLIPFKTIKNHFRHSLQNPRKPLYLSAFSPPPRWSPFIANVIPLGLEQSAGKASVYGDFEHFAILYGETLSFVLPTIWGTLCCISGALCALFRYSSTLNMSNTLNT